MTFDLGTWPLTVWTYEDSYIISIYQVWFKWDLNFSNEAIFTFSVYLTTWPQMTFDLDIWPLTSTTNEGSHVASMTQLLVEIHQSMWKIEPTVNPFFTTDNINRQQQQQWTKWSLWVFPAKAGDTKTGTNLHLQDCNILIAFQPRGSVISGLYTRKGKLSFSLRYIAIFFTISGLTPHLTKTKSDQTNQTNQETQFLGDKEFCMFQTLQYCF